MESDIKGSENDEDSDLANFYFVQSLSRYSAYERKRLKNLKLNYEKLISFGLNVRKPVLFVPHKGAIDSQSYDSDGSWTEPEIMIDSEKDDPNWTPAMDWVTVPIRQRNKRTGKKTRRNRTKTMPKKRKRKDSLSDSDTRDTEVPLNSIKSTPLCNMSGSFEKNNYGDNIESGNSPMLSDSEQRCYMFDPLSVVVDTEVLTEDPDRARKTLPPCLSIFESKIPDAGLGVWTVEPIKSQTRFGPYGGELTRDKDRANNSGYCWKIGSTNLYVDGKDPSKSNWLRYVNCCRWRSEQNLIAYQYGGEIFYKTVVEVPTRTELLVWYGEEYGYELDLKQEQMFSSYFQPLKRKKKKRCMRVSTTSGLCNNKQPIRQKTASVCQIKNNKMKASERENIEEYVKVKRAKRKNFYTNLTRTEIKNDDEENSMDVTDCIDEIVASVDEDNNVDFKVGRDRTVEVKEKNKELLKTEKENDLSTEEENVDLKEENIVSIKEESDKCVDIEEQNEHMNIKDENEKHLNVKEENYTHMVIEVENDKHGNTEEGNNENVYIKDENGDYEYKVGENEDEIMEDKKGDCVDLKKHNNLIVKERSNKHLYINEEIDKYLELEEENCICMEGHVNVFKRQLDNKDNYCDEKQKKDCDIKDEKELHIILKGESDLTAKDKIDKKDTCSSEGNMVKKKRKGLNVLEDSNVQWCKDGNLKPFDLKTKVAFHNVCIQKSFVKLFRCDKILVDKGIVKMNHKMEEGVLTAQSRNLNDLNTTTSKEISDKSCIDKTTQTSSMRQLENMENSSLNILNDRQSCSEPFISEVTSAGENSLGEKRNPYYETVCSEAIHHSTKDAYKNLSYEAVKSNSKVCQNSKFRKKGRNKESKRNYQDTYYSSSSYHNIVNNDCTENVYGPEDIWNIYNSLNVDTYNEFCEENKQYIDMILEKTRVTPTKKKSSSEVHQNIMRYYCNDPAKVATTNIMCERRPFSKSEHLTRKHKRKLKKRNRRHKKQTKIRQEHPSQQLTQDFDSSTKFAMNKSGYQDEIWKTYAMLNSDYSMNEC